MSGTGRWSRVTCNPIEGVQSREGASERASGHQEVDSSYEQSRADSDSSLTADH